MIRQFLYELRHQPLVTWLSITGTALALFLVMTTYMIGNLHNVAVKPESNRARIFYGEGLNIMQKDGSGDSSAGLNYENARYFYSGLEGVEEEAYVEFWSGAHSLQIGNEPPQEFEVRGVDDAYFRIFDFNFEEGAPFDHEESEAGAKHILLARTTADALFGKGEKVVGRKLRLGGNKYTVTGVYTDSHPLLSQSRAAAFVPGNAWRMKENVWAEDFGPYMVVLLASEGVSREDLARQVERRYEAFNRSGKKPDAEAVYHDTPFDSEMVNTPHGTNTTPNTDQARRERLFLYLILLLVPAINLSSLTRSRLRTRVSEIGVRRAFGCTRLSVMWQMIVENFLFSLAGGVIGLVLALLFILFGSNIFMTFGDSMRSMSQFSATPDFSMVFSWKIFLFALLFCFLLNIISASVPAWRASGLHPAEALSGQGARK